MLMGFLGQRRQLTAEIEGLSERRTTLNGESQHATTSAKAAIKEQIIEVDRRTAAVNTALRAVDRAIANLGGESEARVAGGAPARTSVQVQPGSAIASTEPFTSVQSTAFYAGASTLLLVLGVAIGLWAARRFRREAESILALQSDVTGQLAKLSVGIDSVAVEVERLGEGQRFFTKAVTEGQTSTVNARG